MDFLGIFDLANSCCARPNARAVTRKNTEPIPMTSSEPGSISLQRKPYSSYQPQTFFDKNLQAMDLDTTLSGASTPPVTSIDNQSVSNKVSHEQWRPQEAVLNPFSPKYQYRDPSSDHRKYSALFARDRTAYMEADLAIKGDRYLAGIAIGKFPELFACAPHRIQNDVKIASKAVRALPVNVSFVGSEVKKNPAFWQAISRSAVDG